MASEQDVGLADGRLVRVYDTGGGGTSGALTVLWHHGVPDRVLAVDAGRAGAAEPDGLIDDDLAFVSPWGFDVAQIDAPELLVHGGQDRVVPPAHAHWLAQHCRASELWWRPRDGHISVLDAIPVAMDWLRARAGEPQPG